MNWGNILLLTTAMIQFILSNKETHAWILLRLSEYLNVLSYFYSSAVVYFMCQLGYTMVSRYLSNTSLDVAVKAFLKIGLTFKSIDFE